MGAPSNGSDPPDGCSALVNESMTTLAPEESKTEPDALIENPPDLLAGYQCSLGEATASWARQSSTKKRGDMARRIAPVIQTDANLKEIGIERPSTAAKDLSLIKGVEDHHAVGLGLRSSNPF
jgi:hypothetical protein